VEEEAHVHLIHIRIFRAANLHGRVGEELKGHGRSIIRHTFEIRIHSREIRKTEEGSEGSVRSELDADFLFAVSGEGGVEEVDNLAGKGFAGDGAGVGAGVVG
jgi:hypothetical protein